MAKDFSRDFYNSAEWKRARAAYWKRCRGLCDLCLQEGIITPAEIIHHKTPLSEANINDPWTRTSPENLQALCRRHHKMIHSNNPRRYLVKEDGTIIF